MPSTKSKADAALAEGNGHKKELEWHGLTLELPEDLPGETLWGWAAAEDENKSVGPVMDLLRQIIGPEQDRMVREKVVEEGLSFKEAAEAVLDQKDGLFAKILAQYGTEPGESPASEGS